MTGKIGPEIVTVTPVEVVEFPATSLAVAVRMWEPLVAEVVSQETEYGEEVSSVPRFAPSSLNWTPATPTLSEAVAETVTEPDTVAPSAGEVMDTVGGVGSGTTTVITRESGEKSGSPKLSVTVNVTLYVPAVLNATLPGSSRVEFAAPPLN